jgi:hypothetical protein
VSKRYIDRAYAWRTVVPDLKSNSKKTTVEDCLMVSIKELFEKGLIEQNSLRTGSWRWTNTNTFQFDGTIEYQADLRTRERASLGMQYQAEGITMDYSVLLDFVEPRYGGLRWFFRCPIDDIRVTKLFLPPGARRFASRQAHELIYTSWCGPRRRRSRKKSGSLVVIHSHKLATS